MPDLDPLATARPRKTCAPDGVAAVEARARHDRHRLRNALHLACSLLNLQSARLGDAGARREFEAAIERIAALGTIYGAVDAGGDAVPVHRLIDALCGLVPGRRPGIVLALDVAEASLPLERATALGLIVHELVANSLRHGFPDGRAGTITLRLARQARRFWRLDVADDGIGRAADAADGFGSQLVALMAARLDGELRRRAGRGTAYALRFPDTPPVVAASQ